MSYITNSDIETRLGTSVYVQLADDTGSGSADPNIVDEARTSAEGVANSYLARRYAVPVDLTTHPDLDDVLSGIVLDLAVHRLCARRPPIPADVVRHHAAALAWLEQVAAGQVVLPAAIEVAGNTAGGPVAEVSGAKRVVTRSELEGL